MVLSRHFYSVDEVHAALYYTSYRVEYKETLFWCKELLCSGYNSETISTLFEAWIWQRGSFHLQWLIEAWNTLSGDEITEDAILLSAYQLSTCSKRDNSLWNILVLTMDDTIPDHVTPRSPASFPSNNPKEMYFIRALYQGKTKCAWWISRYFIEDRVWWLLKWYVSNVLCNKPEYELCLTIFQQYERLLGYRTEEYDVIIRCLAIITLSTTYNTSTFNPLPAMDPRYMSVVQEWNQCEGRMERRIYSIPSACLYSTRRGYLAWSQQNTVELNYVENGLIGCPFWDEVLQEYSTIENGKIQWLSDDLMEDFYELYFPDDIPDEWTKKEKQKSHGDGIRNPEENVTLLKYARLYLSRGSRLIWNTNADVHRIITGIKDCNPCVIIKEFKTPRDILDSELAPRRKRVII